MFTFSPRSHRMIHLDCQTEQTELQNTDNEDDKCCIAIKINKWLRWDRFDHLAVLHYNGIRKGSHRSLLHHRYRIVALSHHRDRAIAPSFHRHRIIAPLHYRLRSKARRCDGAIEKYMTLSGFHTSKILTLRQFCRDVKTKYYS